MEIIHLQYVDNTLILVDPLIENMWTIKAILRGFNLLLVLELIFHWSSLIGINVDPSLLELDENLLHCKIEYLTFRYMGLLVGSNPRLESTW